MTETDRQFCSFCGQAKAPGRRLVAGPGISICEYCVVAARALFDAAASPAGPSLAPAWQQLSDEEILQHLPEVTRVGGQLEEQLRRWVGAARSRGISWSRIGAALGTTRQTAWERFKDAI